MNTTDYIFIIISITLFFAGLILARKAKAGVASILLLYLFIVLFLLCCIIFAVSVYFTGKSFDESVLYHLFYGISGAGYGEYLGVMLGSLLFLIVGLTLSYAFLSGKQNSYSDIVQSRRGLLSLPLVLAAILLVPSNMHLIGTLFAGQKGDFYKYYRAPRIQAKPVVKHNLVVIYAEGLERTFMDQDMFPGLMPGLRALEKKSTVFTNVTQALATGWTIAGMAASQCGIPLATPSHGNSMNGMDQFLRGAKCLGDLLKEEGYFLSYLGGADSEFSGKGKFYASHGFSEVQGRDILKNRLEDTAYMSPWGLYDDTLFGLAFEKYLDLARNRQPFGLFMLTLDTHPPRGHRSKECGHISYADGANPYLDAVACSDYLISKFVNELLASDYAKNTVIVIASDHLAMNNSTAYGLLKSANRLDLLMIIGPGQESGRKIGNKASTLDTGEAIFHVLGFKADLGLGRDLLAGEQSLSNSMPDFNGRLSSWRNALVKFWDFPAVKEKITINPVLGTVVIDGRELQAPLLITLNKKLETTIWFQFDISPGNKTLIDHLRELDKDTPFIWVDQCRAMQLLERSSGLCVVAGKLGADSIQTIRADNEVEITKEAVQQFVDAKTQDKNYKLNKLQIGL